MSGARLTAALECANDAGVRFTLRRPGDSHGASRLSAGAAASCASADRPAGTAGAAPSEAVATPQSEGLVRVRTQVCFHTPAPVPWGRSRSINPYAGRRFERRFEAADHPFADRPAVWQPGITEQGRGTPDGSGHSPSRQVRDVPVPGDRGATAKQPATYGTAGAHIATAVPCTCTSMSMCTRGTPPTPGDRRSRSAPRAALDTSGKQPAHDSAGLVNREAPARWVIGSERAERRKARRTRNRPSGEDAFSARSFQRADRAVHHRGGIE